MGTSEIGPFSGGNTAIFQRIDGSQANFTSGTTMSFNTVHQSKPWISLSSDVFTIDPGIYSIEVRIVVKEGDSAINRFQISAYDTGLTSVIGGEAEDQYDASEERKTIAKFVVNIASQSTIEIQGSSQSAFFTAVVPLNSPKFSSQVYFTKIG